MGSEPGRLDAFEKVTGEAVYPGDLKRPGLLVGKILPSRVVHGRIKSIRTDRALELPGVLAVLTGTDFPDVRTGMTVRDQHVLTRDKVRYYGEPIAAVAAVDEQTADDALELIEVEIEELPAVLDFEQSVREGAPLVHDEYEQYGTIKPLRRYGNVCLHTTVEKGDIRKGFAESDLIFEDSYEMPVVHQAPMEPKAMVAQWQGGRLRFWCSTARPFAVQHTLSEALGLPISDVRVTALRVGGHFGGKGEPTVEPIAALLAIRAGRAVKLEMSRKDDFLFANPRHSMQITLRTGVKKDGTLVARQILVKADTGAYAYFGPAATSNATVLGPGPYSIPHLHIEGICAYTNKISCGPCRGPGAPQTHFAGESQLDRIARELGLDPFELRLKNAFKEGDTTPTGQVLGYVGYAGALVQLREAVEQYRETAKGAERAVGIGIAGGFWGMPGMGSSAAVTVEEDGTAVLSTGAVEIGAGSNTAMALLVSKGLGIPFQRIRVVSGDTADCPFDFGAIGSRTTQAMGVAVHRAIEGVKDQLLDFAEKRLEAPREILALGDGKIYVKERTELAIPVDRAVREIRASTGEPVSASGSSNASPPPFDENRVESNVAPSRPFFCFGAQAAVVEVDRTTGKVDVLLLIAAHNVGKAVFRAGVEGQIHGGAAMGLGYALTEEVIFSEGKPLNDSFLDYKLPTAEDVPEIVPLVVEKEDAVVPDDILGIGEPPAIPTAAAIANAIHDALGIRMHRLPMTPERIFWALEKAGPLAQRR